MPARAAPRFAAAMALALLALAACSQARTTPVTLSGRRRAPRAVSAGRPSPNHAWLVRAAGRSGWNHPGRVVRRGGAEPGALAVALLASPGRQGYRVVT